MTARLLCFSSILLIAALLSDHGRSFAQGRGIGSSRDGGRTPGVAPRPPAPTSEGTRTVGQTRTAESPAPPARDPAPRHPGRTEPVQQAPSIVDPPPQPRSGRMPASPPPPPPHFEDRPPTVIVIGGSVGGCPVDVPVEIPTSGNWIREGIRWGKDVTLASLTSQPDYSGYDFSELLKRPFDHPYTDMCVEEDNGDLMMSVWEDSEIMDCGAIIVPSDVIYIPRQDWAPDRRVLLIPGHEYVVRTWDHHYAKFFVTGMGPDRVSFDWAYQYAHDENPYVATRSTNRFQR